MGDPAQSRTFLAAHRVEVRHLPVDDGELTGLLFRYHDPVANEYPVGTVAGVAVHAVGGPEDIVPAPAIAIAVYHHLPRPRPELAFLESVSPARIGHDRPPGYGL